MKQKFTNCYIIAVILLLGMCLASYGRVYSTWGAADNAKHTLETIGGNHAYSSDIVINGGDGQMTIMGFDMDLKDLVKYLAKSFPTASIRYSGGSMAIISIETKTKSIKMTSIQVENDYKSIVFLFEQSLSEARDSTLHSQHLLSELPIYPGSNPSFYASDKNTKSSIEMSTTAADAYHAHLFYNLRLTGKGWREIATHSGDKGLSVYGNGSEIAFILIDNSAEQGKTQITLLHKRLGIK